MRATPLKFGRYSSAIVELKGGINENVSSLELQAGELIDCKNYMIAEGGYGGYVSVRGYERMDGRLLPSAYESYIVTIENCTGAIFSGQVVSGDTSGATAIALADGLLLSGSYLAGDAVVRIQCRDRSAQFDPNEPMSAAAVTIGTLQLSETLLGGNDTNNEGIMYGRTLVLPVPGEGPVLGVHVYKRKVYAFRKKTGLAEIGIYVEDASAGWSELTQTVAMAYTGGHKFHFSNYNFLATEAGYYMYFCDGQNQARYFDGSTVEIVDNSVNMGADDKPTNIKAHSNYLFLSYAGGSLQISALGDPTDWTTATEIGTGDDINALTIGVQNTLLIHMDRGIKVLTGNVVSNFKLETFTEETGGYEFTVRRLMGTTFFMTDKGLTTLQAVDTFGDYGSNTISQRFKRTLLDNRQNITTCLTSRELNQYRLYFSNRLGIYVSFEGTEFKGATFVEFANAVDVAAQGNDAEGNDYLVFSDGADTGFIYKMESGTSFDGNPITCRMSTAFFHYGSPRQIKRCKRATVEISGENGQQFDMKVDYDYNEPGSPRTIWYQPEVYTVEGTAVYGESQWGIMKYGVGQAATNRVPIYLQGIGTNMSYKVISNETYRTPHIIQNIITDYETLNRRI